MGVITEAVELLLREFVRDRGLVLWFDPERHYESIIGGLHAGQDQVIAFDGSFYKLRLEAEPFLRGLDPPKLLIYLPIAWEQAEEPLAEMLSLGVNLRPGVSGSRNTRLAVVARKALRGRVADARLADLDRQIEQGRLTLAELEELAGEEGTGPLPTTLTVHFGTALIDEAALDFLARPERDADLGARNGLADWAHALTAQFGIAAEANSSAGHLRTLLARQALTCELLENLGDEAPEALKRLLSSTEPKIATRAAELAKEWRNRRDIAGSYPVAASEIESALHLVSIDFSDAAVERVGTFLSLEQILLRRVAAKVTIDPASVRIAEIRQHGFWAEHDAELQAEWTLVLQAARLIMRAGEIERDLKTRSFSWAELIERYIGEANWAELDTLHRRLERRASSLEYALATPTAEVEQLVHAARRRHQEVSGLQSEEFLRAWRSQNFAISGHIRQTEIYDRYVAPMITNHRTSYVVVDALRWELARELPEVLGGDFEVRMEVAIGVAPSVTEVGMAALLPSAESGLRVDGSTNLQVSLYGKGLKNRADRISLLKERVITPVVDLKLEDPKNFRRKLKDLGDGSALIFVTSREIDQSGEDEMSTAREQMERVLTHLSLALRRLAEEGIEQFVITADHGYLYGEDLAESEKIDPPGGKTALSHRRVWVGQGGAASENYLLTEVSRFGAGSDLEMAVPWTLAGFRTSGPTAYFHGGLSPQEIILPVLLVTPRLAKASKSAKKLTWELSLGSAKITTRFLSVRIVARSQDLFSDVWPIVRIEVRVAGEVCAIPVSASYGFQETTGTVALRSLQTDPPLTEANTVALMLTGKAPGRGILSIHLLDAATGVELKKLENVEVSLAI